MGVGTYFVKQNERDFETSVSRREQVSEEEMYPTNQVIQIAELMATLAYAEGFDYATKKLSESNLKESSKLISQMLGIRDITLMQVNKFVPPKIRKEISLPVGKIKS